MRPWSHRDLLHLVAMRERDTGIFPDKKFQYFHKLKFRGWGLGQLPPNWKYPINDDIYCDESAASPLIISTPRPLIAALHQAPDGSGCVREEGRCNSQVWRRVMRHTPEVNGASSPPLLYAGCASPLETGLFPVHARWCPRGSRKGALRDRVPPKARAAGPAVRTRTAPARRPSGQDAGPTRPIECCRGPRGGRSRWKSHRPSRPGPRRERVRPPDSAPYLDPSFQNTAPPSQPAQHNEDTRFPLLFWTLYSPWTLLLYYFCLIKPLRGLTPHPLCLSCAPPVTLVENAGRRSLDSAVGQHRWRHPLSLAEIRENPHWDGGTTETASQPPKG